MTYNIVIWRDPDGWYVAKNLELGVVSQGETVDEATANIQEATDLYLEDEPANPDRQLFRPALLTHIMR